MNIQKVFKPFEHIIIDDVYNDEELLLIFQELEFLKPKFKAPTETGSAMNRETGLPLKKNRSIFLDNVYTEREMSDILRVNRKVFSMDVLRSLSEMHPSYGSALLCDSDYTLLNYYDDGDHYLPHSDRSSFTLITFLASKAAQYAGGEFLFSDFDYVVPQLNNRTVIFPGCVRHQVKEVGVADQKYVGRFSMAQFLNLKY